MGALLADTPHTRPVPVSATASDDELMERFGLARSTYEGPTGIVGVLHDACARAGLRSASLWAATPHYISATPNPQAALALLERLSEMIGTPPGSSELERAASEYALRVASAISDDPDIAGYVQQLEEAADTADPPTSAPMRPATPSHGECRPPWRSRGARRDPMIAPTANPARPRRVATRPRCAPRNADSATPPSTRRSMPLTAVVYRPSGAAGPGVCQTAGVEFVHIEHDPALRRPNLVAAFRGWNDAGGAASLAAGYLRAVTDAERCAVIDSEPFIDYQQTRPTVELVDGDIRRLDWPETEV